ncbi:hypothetical protein L3Q82_023392, partial [Scortum barcoo]
MLCLQVSTLVEDGDDGSLGSGAHRLRSLSKDCN